MTKRQTISNVGGHLSLLTSTSEVLYDALRDPDCPVRELPAIARRLQEIQMQITDYDPTAKRLQDHLEMLDYITATMTRGLNSDECSFRDLSPLTRQLEKAMRETDTIRERLKHAKDARNGSAKSVDESFDRGQI